MPPNPSASSSPRTRTPRSGSSATKPEPAAPPTLGPRLPPRAYVAVSLSAFALLHILLDLYLGLRPGDYTGLPGTRLLEIFVGWFPILFLGTYLAFSTHVRISTATRFTILLVYANLAIIALILPLLGRTFLGLTISSQDTFPWFDLLLRFAPIPALVFLFGTGRYRWSISRAIGLALIFTMFWRSLYYNFPELLVIAAGGGVRPPTPAYVHYLGFFLSVLWDLVYPILGLLFFFHRVPWIHRPPEWGRQLEAILRPLGSWVRRRVHIDLAWGALLFIGNLVAIYFLSYLLAQGSTSEVGDDSAVFRNILLDQVFLISIIAGVGEELVYRGILQSGLTRLIGRGLKGASVSILVTSLAFGIAHGGYQDLDHLIYPFLFGLFIGYVYHFFGLIPAILIHIEIDIIAFGLEYARAPTTSMGAAEAMVGFLGLLLLANFAYGVIVLAMDYQRRYAARASA